MFHRLVGKDHAPAEGVARTVALEHGDLMLRISELHRNREIEPRGASANACDLHMPNPDSFDGTGIGPLPIRSEEHTSELQSLMRISYAVFCLKKKTNIKMITKTS